MKQITSPLSCARLVAFCSLIPLCYGLFLFLQDALGVSGEHIEHFEQKISEEFSVKQLHLQQTREHLTREFWQTLCQPYPAPITIRADRSELRLVYRGDKPILYEELWGIKGHFLEHKEEPFSQQESSDSAVWKLFSCANARIDYEKKLFQSDGVDLQFIPALYDKSQKRFAIPGPYQGAASLLEGKAQSLSIDFNHTPAVFKISSFRALISEEGREKWITPTIEQDGERQ